MKENPELNENGAVEATKVLRHIVMFGFNPEVSVEEKIIIEEAFAQLPQKISSIIAFEWGKDCSPEGLQQGLTHCFTLTFTSDADRDAYIVNPDHQDFVKLLDGKLAHVTVFDYWTK